ncbi:chemotaxis protein CheA [Endozoicomonas sp. SM1973]|uniref:Chemotaxis protein CheA n=1 Tax=Spartinivicinus marinus TaxID=2994442 RepID=A0A853HW62_9GAMM|nr:chemotaxis protein CheA [Spartinivicinus marinus]MCX4025269.1 chemotaxis protein CheA [Spartinivicinus marinus]NYZ65990.1 chemotaxis protein CheA [Spartinivicinus marinus]
MTINVEQFHQIFFEECIENLNIIEQGLLSFGNASIDEEIVNHVFRASHSIKGSAATFNFIDIAEITHELEFTLDLVREGKRELLQQDVAHMLTAVDAVYKIVEMRKEGNKSPLADQQIVITLLRNIVNSQSHSFIDKQTDIQTINTQSELLDLAIHHSDDGVKQTLQTEHNSEEQQMVNEWEIIFIPCRHIFLTGNDPIRFIRELAELAELTVETNIKQLPDWEFIEPEDCFLSWYIKLKGAITKSTILEVFEWIADECQLTIAPLQKEEVIKQEVKQTEPDTSSWSFVGINPEKVNKKNSQAQQLATVKQEQPSAINTSNPSIRVNVEKIDHLFNLVGELVITQSMLSELGSKLSVDALGSIERLQSGLAQLLQNTKELQESVMQIRMVPISFIFNRFPRIVHDLSNQLGKKVDLKIEGEGTELDKNVMEQLVDPLVHLVRNALDHGIETTENRLQANKPATGIIQLSAYHRGGNIVIDIFDDGAGLNRQAILNKAQTKGIIKSSEHLSVAQIFELIFEPGFSTVKTVTDVSGRGVGMDVVRKNIYSLGGNITVESEQGGFSRFQISLPLTLAILDGQLVKVGSETYVIPLNTIVESLQMIPDALQQVSGALEVYRLRQENIPIIRLYELLNITPVKADLTSALLVVVEAEGNKFGLLVDDLLAQQQVVIKNLEANYDKVPGISGATILGDGTVALILDISGLIRLITDELFVKPCAA